MTVQLIYQGGRSNKFWNVVVEENKHTVTYGRIGTVGTSKTKEFVDETAAIKDAEKLINAKKRKGYIEVTAKADVVRDGHTFAGKPISVFSSTLDTATAVKVLSGYDEKLKVVDKLDKLAALPNANQMDALIIGAWQEVYDSTSGINAIIDKLIALKETFVGLKHLFIGDMSYEECEMSWINQTNYSQFYQHYPSLETFGTRGGQNLVLGKIQLPNLKHLIVESGGLSDDVLKDIINSELSELEHLEIWLGTNEYGCTIKPEDVQPILNGNYPNLKYLGLKNYYRQDDLALLLAGTKILENLETLDLSMGTLSDKGALALYQNKALLNLNHINCRHHFISSNWQIKLKVKFINQTINLNGAEEADDWDGEPPYYVEIGE